MADCCDIPVPLNPAGLPGGRGQKGDKGDDGDQGDPGVNSFTTSTAGFVMPAAAGSVTFNVANSSWAALGQTVFVEGAGYFSVTTLPSATSMQLTALAIPTNTAATTLIASGKKVSPAGVSYIDSYAALNSRVTALEGTTSTGNKTYFTGTAPTGPGLAIGDIWFDTANNNKIMRWDGTGWVDAQRVLTLSDFGTGIQPIQTLATLPGTGTVGQFVLLTTDKKLYRWNGTAWTKAISTGELTGQVDASTFVIDGTVIAQKLGAASVTAAAVGANLIITNAANIGTAIITDAHISFLNAAKITAGDLTVGVRMNAVNQLYNTSAPSKSFRSIEQNGAFANSFAYGTGTAFSFNHPTPVKFYCPGHADAGIVGPIINPDASGTLRVLFFGRLLGYTGNLTIYYRKNNTGSYLPLNAVSSSDGGNAETSGFRGAGYLTGFSTTDTIWFYIAPCDGSGDLPIAVTCRYELDIIAFNW